MTNSKQSSVIRLFLRGQRMAQKNATIDSVRRLSRWTERLYPAASGVTRVITTERDSQVEWLIPKESSSNHVIFYIHGGGFVLPLYNPSRYVAAHLARLTGLRIMLPAYRLAPEHPFPAALQDCLAAIQWLLSQEDIRPEKVIIVGESAGGNLAISMMLAMRDEGDSLPLAAVTISPILDFEGHGSFYEADDPMVDAEFVMRQLNAYRGDVHTRHPLLSPLHADLRGLPPMLIQVGGSECLRTGAERFADSAQRQGVPATLELWQGMWHYWHLFLPFLPEAKQAMQSISQFIQAQVRSDPKSAPIPAS